jgi:hypothetical protein
VSRGRGGARLTPTGRDCQAGWRAANTIPGPSGARRNAGTGGASLSCRKDRLGILASNLPRLLGDAPGVIESYCERGRRGYAPAISRGRREHAPTVCAGDAATSRGQSHWALLRRFRVLSMACNLARALASIWRMRSRVTPNRLATSSSVRGCSPLRPKRNSMTLRSR